MIICVYCRSRVLETDRKCQACGSTSFQKMPDKAEPPVAPLEKERKIESQKNVMAFADVPVPRYSARNRWIALTLCALGGFLGIHRFYVGKIWTGILFLLTGGFFFIGPIVDGCTILFGHFRDKDGLLLK